MAWIISQALMKAYENSPCSQEQAVESSGGTCLDGAQSQQSNTSPMPQAYLSPDKMTAFSRLFRFGMTFAPLTDDRGADLLMWYLAGFRVKTSAQQEKAQESTENDQGSGEKWRGWLAKYDPDTSTWKTAQCSLIEDSVESLETWPRSGMTVGGRLWELPMSERRIKGTEFGLSPQTWPTPDANCGQRGTQPNWTPKRKSGQPAQYTINQAIRDKMFPTPQASDCRDRGNMSNTSIQRRAKKGKQLNLSMVAHPTSGKLNPDWVEWLMNWPIKWSSINEFNPKKFKRWQETSATPLQESGQMRTVWWDRDPSQASHRPQHKQQQEQQHSNSLPRVSRGASCEPTMEGSHKGQDLPVLRDSVHLQTSERENLQSGVWEQTCMDETQIVPRVGGTGIATVDRLKAIGNGQVPAVAAAAWIELTR